VQVQFANGRGLVVSVGLIQVKKGVLFGGRCADKALELEVHG
jgi:hypothetical protein